MIKARLAGFFNYNSDTYSQRLITLSNQEPVKLASGGLLNAEYLAHARQTFLSAEQEAEFIEACGRPLRKSIRFNSLKCSREAFLTIAVKYDWRLTPVPWCNEGFWVEVADESVSLGNLPEHIQGLFYIQEASSMLPPLALLVDNEIEAPLVVDMAAAPGSKTTQLAAMLGNQGIVLANELSASRLKSLHNNLVRCGILNTCMSHHDGRKIGEYMPDQFDYVLLDAPCGGEGTVRKDTQALSDWRLDKVEELSKLQKELILSAYTALKPGGKLVYSTCTLSPEENHLVADHLLASTNAKAVDLSHLFKGSERAATPQGYLHVLPHLFDSEGFFIACFNKPADEPVTETLTPIFNSPFEPISNKLKQRFVDYYQQQFGFDIELSGYRLMQRGKEVWLFPEDIASVNQYIKVNRAGMRLAEVYPNKIRSTHELACCIGHLSQRQTLELDNSQFESFLRGQNVEVESQKIDKGEVFLTFKNQIVGIAQHQNSKLKNGLPRELVRDSYQLVKEKA